MVLGATMIVRTRRNLPFSASAVWPLLCESEMHGAPALPFRLHAPRPIACRLPSGPGGVGGERECVTDQGRVRQRILEWAPPARLRFRMERTDLPQLRAVADLVDTFDLAPGPRSTVVTRTTVVRFRPPVSFARRFLLFLGLKEVHRYVFRSWRRAMEEGARRLGRTATDGPSSLAT